MKTPKQRSQIQEDDAASPSRLRRVLNDIILDLSTRIEKLEAAKGITQLDEVQFDTGAAVAVGTKPFDGSLRLSCPDFTPTGLVLLQVERIRPAGQPVITNAVDLKWRFLGGRKQGGTVVIDFMTGLATNSTYTMRVGATRA